jgi:hypothetical protein
MTEKGDRCRAAVEELKNAFADLLGPEAMVQFEPIINMMFPAIEQYENIQEQMKHGDA